MRALSLVLACVALTGCVRTDDERAVEIMEGLAKTARENTQSCEALGAAIGAYIDGHVEVIRRLKAAPATPDKNTVVELDKRRMSATQIVVSTLRPCVGHPKVAEALSKM